MHTSNVIHRVLVVEDEWLVRMEVADELQAAGWTVSEAATGEVALAMLPQGRFDLLVTDIRLPGQRDGWHVAQAFREAFPRAPVIYVSANPDLPGRRVTDSVFMDKPCDMIRLLAMCEKLAGV
jgi:DNA-binding response OmpR family regulator